MLFITIGLYYILYYVFIVYAVHFVYLLLEF